MAFSVCDIFDADLSRHFIAIRYCKNIDIIIMSNNVIDREFDDIGMVYNSKHWRPPNRKDVLTNKSYIRSTHGEIKENCRQLLIYL